LSTTIYIDVPPLHVNQASVEANANRFNVLCCGRRWGKTRFGIDRILNGPGNILDTNYGVGWFAPSSRYYEDVIDEVDEILDPIIAKRNRQLGRFKFVTGASLDFWPLGENKNAARGKKYRRVIVDEAAHIRHLADAWEKSVEPTLTDLLGEAWFISTPNELNYFKTLFDRGQAGEFPDWASWQMPSSSNPHLSGSEIERKRGELPYLVFLQEYLAQFVTFGAGLVSKEMLLDAPAPPGLPVVLGVDLAISEKQTADYTAICAMCRDIERGTIYMKEIERHRVGFHDILERVKAAAARHNPVMIAIEENQFQAAVVQELARTTTLPVRGFRSDRDKLTRFAPLLTRFEQLMVRLCPSGVPAWFRDEIITFPKGEHDDGVDAASLAFNNLPAVLDLSGVASSGIKRVGVTV